MGQEKFMKGALVAALSLVLVGGAQAAEIDRPFGIERGQALSGLKVGRPSGNSFELAVPKPHPMLSKYAIVATALNGVCSVSGFAPLMADRDHADEIIETLKQHVSDVLGEPMFLPGRIRQPENTGIWLWLPKWEPGQAHSPLKDVALYRFEAGGRKGVQLQFSFTNESECDPKKPAIQNPFK